MLWSVLTVIIYQVSVIIGVNVHKAAKLEPPPLSLFKPMSFLASEPHFLSHATRTMKLSFRGDSRKKYLGGWPLIIWEAIMSKRNYYRTNYIKHVEKLGLNHPEKWGVGVDKIWGACAPWPQHRTATAVFHNITKIKMTSNDMPITPSLSQFHSNF